MMRKLLAASLAFFISALAIVFGCGFTATGEAELYYSGKSEIAVNVQSDKNEEEFGEIVNEYIRQYRYIDKALLVEAKKIQKIEGGYKVIAKTRRIDKVKGVGQFELEAFNRYAADGSQTKWNLEYWAGQDYKITRRVYFDSVSSSVSLSSKAGKKYYCTPKTAAGDDVDLDTFCAFGENSKDRVRILTFCLFLSDAVTSVRVKLPGAISHYAGDAVVLDGENGFILQPKKIDAQVTLNGVTEDRSVSAAIGYVVFDRGFSPVARVFIILGVAAAIALIAAIVIALYRAGLKRIARLEREEKAKPAENELPPSENAAESFIERTRSKGENDR